MSETRQNEKKAILFVQFGSPLSYHESDVKNFLFEILHDSLFTFLPARLRSFVIKTCILPFMTSKIAARYKSLWMKNESPLVFHSNAFLAKIQPLLPSHSTASLGMLYGTPSIDEALKKLSPASSLCILPLFPHRTKLTEKIFTECATVLESWNTKPTWTFFSAFADKRFFCNSWAEKILEAHPEKYDHILFSFHAMPSPNDSYYTACKQTAYTLAEKTALHSFSFAFQSEMRFGRWLTPSIKEELLSLYKKGKTKILIVPLSFVADCSETLFEIEQEYKNFFLKIGGKELQCIPSLNDHDCWVKNIAQFICTEGFSK